MFMIRLLALLAVIFLAVMLGCNRSISTPPPLVTGSDTSATSLTSKTITAFVVKAADNPGVITTDVTAHIVSDSIYLSLDTGTNLSSLVPTITITGKAVNPPSKAPENFGSALVYTVTAHDGSTMAYYVVVSLAAQH